MSIDPAKLLAQVRVVSVALEHLQVMLNDEAGSVGESAAYQLGMARAAEGIARKAVQQVHVAVGGMCRADFIK